MDRFTEQQQKIDQRAAEVKAEYPALWSKMIQDWHQPGSEDCSWLMYSANYLFRTNNVRWAIDPLRLKQRLPDAPMITVGDLKDLEFILLTHQHSDHLDLNLLYDLRDLPIIWVVPAPILQIVQDKVRIPVDRLVIPEQFRIIDIRGIRITPFDGLHWEKQLGTNKVHGVPAMGYHVESKGKRWLFPGDIRTYDTSQLPAFDAIDILFAHLWLGRGSALLDMPPLLNDFCHLSVKLQPKRIVLTHLEEFGRDANDYWDRGHVQMVSSLFGKIRSIFRFLLPLWAIE